MHILHISIFSSIPFHPWNVYDARYGLWKQPCDGGAKQCWFTLFFAAGARQLFPCFDEPSAKATFSVRVARTAGWATL